ncbi:4812_t:CDS:1, partial [Dentiscutata heterogama]
SNTELDLKVEDKKKADNKELKKDMTEELVYELEKISLVIFILMNIKIVENVQRISKDNKQKKTSVKTNTNKAN